MKYLYIAMLVALVSGLSYFALSEGETTHPLDAYGMAEEDIYDTVEFLESTQFETGELQAGLTADKLTVSNEKGAVEYGMPDDYFYASIAPYYENTHPCGDHNLVTCQAELDKESFEVTVHDKEGDIVFDGTVQSEANGFFGIWLPRNLEGSIIIEHGDGMVEGDIQTFSDSGTCFTDYQLN